jgi:hypothetical protein
MNSQKVFRRAAIIGLVFCGFLPNPITAQQTTTTTTTTTTTQNSDGTTTTTVEETTTTESAAQPKATGPKLIGPTGVTGTIRRSDRRQDRRAGNPRID